MQRWFQMVHGKITLFLQGIRKYHLMYTKTSEKPVLKIAKILSQIIIMKSSLLRIKMEMQLKSQKT